MSDRLAPKIEAILYLKGQPLSLSQISEYAGCDRADAEEALLDLIDDYAHRETALEVVETESGYSLQLREAFQQVMQALVPAELGVGALRTLAAIALKGPLLQSDLVELRGSGAYQHVQELVQLGLIKRRRGEGNGRSYRVQVTEKFHQYFQVENLPLLERMVLPSREDDEPER